MYILLKTANMSRAFVKEEDDQWLHEIPGTITALINYLTKDQRPTLKDQRRAA